VSDPDTILLLALRLLTRLSFTSGLTQTPNPDTVLPLPVRCEGSQITWGPVLAIRAHKKIFYQVETATGNYTINCNPITMDPFYYYAEYRVLICKSCQYAVHPFINIGITRYNLRRSLSKPKQLKYNISLTRL
jgi:hypothetical protein